MATATATAFPRSGSPAQGKATQHRGPPAIALIIYPLTLILGSIYSVVSPTARQSSTSLTPTIAADINLPTDRKPSPVNYFARKDNIFNVYFVKVGWVWTTLAFVALVLTQPYFTKVSASLRRNRTVQAFLRYAIVTAAWFLTTQWFFGPAIIDRTFVLTGGKCERLPPLSATADAWEELKVVLSSAACKAAGGAWRGGHDVSGHVFMLVLGSAFLAFEALGASNSPESESKEKDDSTGHSIEIHNPVPTFVSRFVWVVVGLSWWMLFMTAIWFHTWIEKLSGLVISLGVLYITYLLPQDLSPWRDLIGIPGL